MAVLSMATETTEDPKVVELCVEGFRHAIHCAGLLGMVTERAALVTALCNFTTLEAAGSGVRRSFISSTIISAGLSTQLAVERHTPLSTVLLTAGAYFRCT